MDRPRSLTYQGVLPRLPIYPLLVDSIRLFFFIEKFVHLVTPLRHHPFSCLRTLRQQLDPIPILEGDRTLASVDGRPTRRNEIVELGFQPELPLLVTILT